MMTDGTRGMDNLGMWIPSLPEGWAVHGLQYYFIDGTSGWRASVYRLSGTPGSGCGSGTNPREAILKAMDDAGIGQTTPDMLSGSAPSLGASDRCVNVQNSKATLTQTAPSEANVREAERQPLFVGVDSGDQDTTSVCFRRGDVIEATFHGKEAELMAEIIAEKDTELRAQISELMAKHASAMRLLVETEEANTRIRADANRLCDAIAKLRIELFYCCKQADKTGRGPLELPVMHPTRLAYESGKNTEDAFEQKWEKK